MWDETSGAVIKIVLGYFKPSGHGKTTFGMHQHGYCHDWCILYMSIPFDIPLIQTK